LAETQAGGCGGLCVEGVVGVDPCADAWFAGDFGEEGQCEGGSAGGFRSGEFADGADREATVEQSIYLGDAGGGGIAEGARLGGERGWEAAFEGEFDLFAEDGSGGHCFAFSSLSWRKMKAVSKRGPGFLVIALF
jgi:hypothetical protein